MWNENKELIFIKDCTVCYTGFMQFHKAMIIKS